MTRPSWDRTWMDVADIIAKRSRCDGRQIGAVIVSPDNGYVVTGYNGPPARWNPFGGETCVNWCSRRQTGQQTHDYANCVSIHAEANALMRAEHSMIQGGTLYVTSSSCWDCGKLAANSGVERIVMRTSDTQDAHRNPIQTRKLLRQSGLTVVVYDE